jgi:hypothetical protein
MKITQVGKVFFDADGKQFVTGWVFDGSTARAVGMYHHRYHHRTLGDLLGGYTIQELSEIAGNQNQHRGGLPSDHHPISTEDVLVTKTLPQICIGHYFSDGRCLVEVVALHDDYLVCRDVLQEENDPRTINVPKRKIEHEWYRVYAERSA